MRRLRDLLANGEEPYAGVDLANASRIGGAVWIAAAALALVLLPFDPPNEALGDAGWVAAGAVIAAAFAAGWSMRRMGGSVDVDKLLAFSYAALATIAAMVWLSGGKDSPYGQLLLLGVLYTSAVHPPRRVLAYLAALAVVTLLPLVYSDWSTRETVTFVTELLVWLVLAVVVMVMMAIVRTQRLGLRQEGERARRQARVDPLTGLLNRRAFDEALANATDRSRTTGYPLSVLVGDIDDFKDFNDRYGHLEGDRVLQGVAESLRAALRRPDVAYRWGGDEFAVILPEADQAGAEQVAQRVRAAVARNTGPDAAPLGLATGVAEFDPDGGQSAEELLDAADQALLRRKGSGAFEVPRTRG
jgi:diguanylate cyclase (GGDEF)-like protein